MLKTQSWKKPEYTKRQINDAGDIIRNPNSSIEEIDFATKVIDNWRAAHAYPLHVFYIHLRRMASHRKDILVVERLKRLDSIVGKLKREQGMDLWRMQDLGGCRFVVPSVEDVYNFSTKYQKSQIRHEFKRAYDYIANPKPSGYRSLHLVYKYHSDTKETYNNNMLIELQFRTRLQHIWATALETMGIFTKQALKAGQGEEYIKRFFVVVSSLFAIKEGYPIVPGTINDEKELITEVEYLNTQYHLLDMLSAIQVFMNREREIESLSKKDGYYLLILNYNTRMLSIKYFQPSQIEEANEAYMLIEKKREESNVDAVLVRAESFKELKAAYPNYFADISEFVSLVRAYLV